MMGVIDDGAAKFPLLDDQADMLRGADSVEIESLGRGD